MGILDRAKKKSKRPAKPKGRDREEAKRPTKAKKPIVDEPDGLDASAPIADLFRDHMAAHKTKPEARKPGEARHYLMWVGGSNVPAGGRKEFPGYPTVESYIKEARRMGVSKRLNMVTPHLIPGVTRIYLAHGRIFEIARGYLNNDGRIGGEDVPKISRIKAVRKVGRALEDKEDRPARAVWQTYHDQIGPIYRNDWTFQNKVNARLNEIRGERGDGETWEAIVDVAADFARALEDERAVIGYFTIQKLEYILPTGWTEDQIPPKVKELIDKGICVVVREEDERAVALQPRGCGWRKPNGTYAVAYEDQSEGRAGLHSAGPLWLATTPVPVPGLDFYRGLRSIPDKLANLLSLEMELGQGQNIK